MVSTLEKYYLSKGYGLPKYSYLNLVDDNGFKMYCAEVILPNGITVRGEPSHSYAEVIKFCSIIIWYNMFYKLINL